MAFHFDAVYAANALANLSPDHELFFVVGRMRGPTAFDFADRIFVAAMFEEAGSGNPEVGQNVVKEWTIGLSNKIADFHAKIMQDLFEQYGLMRDQREVELRDRYCAAPGDVFIPLSTLDTTDES